MIDPFTLFYICLVIALGLFAWFGAKCSRRAKHVHEDHVRRQEES